MRAVDVRRLALRAPPGHGAAARQRVEDALFLAAPDETRLVILRRLPLGRMPARADAPIWTERVAERLAERRARAVHGAQPGAEDAEAVWFRSAEEAQALLLQLLAAGRFPAAWFWRLAVPEWQGLGLPQVVAHWAAAAERQPQQAVRLARALVAAIEAGLLPALVAAVHSARMPRAAHAAVPATAAPGTAATAPLVQAAERLAARHTATVRRAVQGALSGRAVSVEAAWLVRFVLLAAAPEMAMHPSELAALADALAVAWSRADAAQPARPQVPLAPDRPVEHRVERARPGALTPGTEPAPIHRPEAAPRTGDAAPPPHAEAAPDAAAATPVAAPAPAQPAAEELASAGAGVLLVIQALDRMGLTEWLAGDSEAAAAAFGRHLLRHIALRARLPPEDALFALLDAPDPAPDPDVLQAWRVGLDRWLRRQARLRLCDLARRRGWLHLADTILQVRFPHDAADLRLRRLALDSDPNWVPWLGLSVRYHYRDSALA